jgi:hypothetical protein
MKMKIVIFILLSMSIFHANAYYEDPLQPFPARNNFTNQSNITWRYVANVQPECERESKRLGLGGFGYSIEACSFWQKRNGKDQCTIITGLNPNFNTVGHEIRHCFQGRFHK